MKRRRTDHGLQEGATLREKPARPGLTESEWASVREVARALNAFGARLFARLRADAPTANLVVSPFNVATALTLTLAGAAGQTAAQLAAALGAGADLDDDTVHEQVRNLLRSLDGAAFHAASRMWGKLELEPEPRFLSIARNDYGAPFESIYPLRPTDAAAAMNTWVAEQTAGRIADLIAADSLSSLTRLVLISASYFKAPWGEPFPIAATQPAPFTRRDGSRVEVPMMHLRASLGHALTPSAHVVELGLGSPASGPAEAPRFSMLLALPTGRADELVYEHLAAIQTVDPMRGGDRYRADVELWLPRFKVACTFELTSTLAAMGMPDLCGPLANFSRISDAEALSLDAFKHQVVVEVDEAGATAAAATVVEMAFLSAEPLRPIVMRFDRPFLFLLRENRSNLVLFAGWVQDPSSPPTTEGAPA